MKMVDIQQIKETYDIVKVIGSDIPLKQSGGWYMGKCPFHSDDTPSLGVSDSKMFWKCFSCGAKGDVIAWIRKFYGLSFPQALQHLIGSDEELFALRKAPELSPKEKEWADHMLELTRQLERIFVLQGEKLRARRGTDPATVQKRRMHWKRAHGEVIAALQVVKETSEKLAALDILAPNLRQQDMLRASISASALTYVYGSDMFRHQLIALCTKET